MDSFTQIVLGAACGEAVAGRKLGNRAMLWGAIGGTIPDLDVFAVFFTDQINSISFHRGFMHSIAFAVLMPWLMAWLARMFYSNEVHQRKGYKASAMIIWLLFYVGAAAGINFIPVLMGEGLRWYILLPTLLLGAWLLRALWRDYWKRNLSMVQASYKTWVWLFFWSIFTHPLLDCFTNWGTQLWQPFSDYRIQWNTVSVVDPMYTVPFMLCLIVASFFGRDRWIRLALCWAGIIWSCSFLGFTCWHKMRVDTIFEQSLQAKNIQYNRYMSCPAITTNVVWYGLAESDSAYYFGMYGFNDRLAEFRKISTIPKNHHLLDPVGPDTRAGYFLRWMSNGYYNVLPGGGDTLVVNDLRFGLIGDSLIGNNYVFPYLLFKNEQGEWDVRQDNKNRKNVSKSLVAIKELWNRVRNGY